MVTGCSKTFIIDSTPAGAQAYIAGEYLGYTPTAYKADCTTFGETPQVSLHKPGYFQSLTTLPYEVSYLNIALDAIFFWPMLFVNAECPKDYYNIKLRSYVDEIAGRP